MNASAPHRLHRSLWLPLLAALLAPHHASAADHGPDPLEAYNLALGTQAFGIRYTFTDDTGLVEASRRIHAMGSNVLKISASDDYARQYPGLDRDPEIQSLVDLVRREPSYRRVLEMPFAHYHLWIYPFHAGHAHWRNGLADHHAQQDYDEIYALACYLLETYSGTGKTFYLGHWEGDWHLHADYDPDNEPTDATLQGMIDWLNVRQRAIDDAKRDTDHHDVALWHYTEVNLVDKALDGRTCLTNDVLPHTNVDYVSYSAYDRLNDGLPDDADLDHIRQRLHPALDHIESKLPGKDNLPPGRRVWLGEFGYPLQNVEAPREQARLQRLTARAALEWGTPFVLQWAFYCNEQHDDGSHRGFWLIDHENRKQPYYHTLETFYEQSRQYLRDFQAQHDRLPTPDEYHAHAVRLLEQIDP